MPVSTDGWHSRQSTDISAPESGVLEVAATFRRSIFIQASAVGDRSQHDFITWPATCGPAKNQPDQDIIGRQKAKGAGNVVQASLNQAREAASQQEDQNRNEQDAAYQSGARKHCKPPRLIGCQVHGLIQGTVEIISRYARLQELERIEALDAIAKQE